MTHKQWLWDKAYLFALWAILRCYRVRESIFDNQKLVVSCLHHLNTHATFSLIPYGFPFESPLFEQLFDLVINSQLLILLAIVMQVQS